MEWYSSIGFFKIASILAHFGDFSIPLIAPGLGENLHSSELFPGLLVKTYLEEMRKPFFFVFGSALYMKVLGLSSVIRFHLPLWFYDGGRIRPNQGELVWAVSVPKGLIFVSYRLLWFFTWLLFVQLWGCASWVESTSRKAFIGTLMIYYSLGWIFLASSVLPRLLAQS